MEGERSGLFFEIMRLAKEIKPKFLFLENVPAITHRGGLRVVRDITEMGYDCRWCVISASGVGALHRRERWFLLAHSKHNGASACEGRESIGSSIASREQHEQEEMFGKIERASCLSTDVAHANESTGRRELRDLQEENDELFKSKEQRENKATESNNGSQNVADSQSKRLERQWRSTERKVKEQSEPSMRSEDDGNANSIPSREANTRAVTQYIKSQAWGEYSLYRPFKSRNDWQKIVSEMGKCSDGLPHQVDRLKALGNAVVPQQVRKAWMILTGLQCQLPLPKGRINI